MDPEKINRTRPDHVWSAEKKIITQRISGGKKPLIVALDLYKRRTFNSVNNIILHEKYTYLYEPLETLLNSDLINWYYSKNFSNNSDLTVNISKTFLEVVPISDNITKDKWVKILTLFSQISRYSKVKYLHIFETFSKCSNALIFELYFYKHMKSINIDIMQFIERDIDVTLKNNEFDTFSDSQKESLIHELDSLWSDSNSEVLKRINSFSEKSPNILKPILEG